MSVLCAILVGVKKLTRLDPKHKAACRLKIEGKENVEIAKAVGAQKRTVEVWFSDDLVRDYLQRLAENVEQEFAVQLAGAGMQAVQSLVDMLNKPDRESDISDSGKMRAATEILDRLPGTSKVNERQVPITPPGGDVNNLTQIFANMPDSELANFLSGGWKEDAIESGATQSSLPAANGGGPSKA